jgi:phosphatidylglycerophosphate synthase
VLLHTVNAETAPLFERSRKPQPSTELVCERVFRPLAHLVVLALAPLRVSPPAVVLAGAGVGVAAAVETGRGELLAAALLLQLKTVVDNADGQLARATGRVTAFGRYLDSECDLLVNAAVFAAIGWKTGSWLLAAVGFVLSTLLMGINFNLKHLYRLAHGHASETEPPATGAGAVLARIYHWVYGPEDRLIERFVDWRVRRLGGDAARYHDARTLAVVAQFGLSTQLLVLGACLAAGQPLAYCWLVVGVTVLLVPLELRRGRLTRKEIAWS